MRATPLSARVFSIMRVAKCSNPGTTLWTALGTFHAMSRNHLGPKGIFMGMAGLPSGETSSRGSFFSSSRP